MDENPNNDVELTELEQEEVGKKAQEIGVSSETLEEQFKKLKSLATKRCEAGFASLSLSQEEKEMAKVELLSRIHQEFFERIDIEGVEKVEDIIKSLVIEKGEMAQSPVAIGRLIGGNSIEERHVTEQKVVEARYNAVMATIGKINGKETSFETSDSKNNVVSGVNMNHYYQEIEKKSYKSFLDAMDKYGRHSEKAKEAYDDYIKGEDYNREKDFALHYLFVLDDYADDENRPPFDVIPNTDKADMMKELYAVWKIAYGSGKEDNHDEVEIFKSKIAAAKEIFPPEFFDENDSINMEYFEEQYRSTFLDVFPDEEFDLDKIFEDFMKGFSDEKCETEFLNEEDMRYEKLATSRAFSIGHLVTDWLLDKEGVTDERVFSYMAKNLPGLMRYLDAKNASMFIEQPDESGLYPKDEQGRLIVDPKMKKIQDVGVDILLEAYEVEKEKDIRENRQGVEKYVDGFTQEKYKNIVREKIITDVITTGRADPAFIEKALRICPEVLKVAIDDVLRYKSGEIMENGVKFDISLENILSNEGQVKTLLSAEQIEIPFFVDGVLLYEPVYYGDIDRKLQELSERGEYGVEADYTERSKLAEISQLRLKKEARRKKEMAEAAGLPEEEIDDLDDSEVGIQVEELREYRELINDFQDVDSKDFMALCAFASSHNGLTQINVVNDKLKNAAIGQPLERRVSFNAGLKRLNDAHRIVRMIAANGISKDSTNEARIAGHMKKLAVEEPDAFIDAIDYMSHVREKSGRDIDAFKPALDLIDKTREGFLTIVNTDMPIENKKELIMQYTKANPELMAYIYRDYTAKQNIPRVSEEVMDCTKEAFYFVTRALEFERSITIQEDDRTLRDMASRMSPEQMEFIRQRINAGNESSSKGEDSNRKTKMDELFLYSKMDGFVNSVDRQENMENLSKTLEECNAEAVKKVVIEALTSGKIKGNIVDNGFLETVIRHTGIEFLDEIEASLRDRSQGANSTKYIIQLYNIMQGAKEIRSIFDENQVDIGELSGTDQLIQKDPTTPEPSIDDPEK